MTLGKGIEQFYIFLVFFAHGALSALSYIFLQRIFRKCVFLSDGILRRVLKNRLFPIFSDAVCFSVAAFLLWWLNLQCNNGEFRLFVPLAFLVGVVVSCTVCKIGKS